MTRRMTIALTTLLAGVLLPGAVSTASAQGSREAIKVHGHWTIDIRQPDGTLVSHREFENALTSDGGVLLTRFLTRTHSPGEWVVVLNGQTDLCRNPYDQPCYVAEPTFNRSLGGFTVNAKNLEVVQLASGIRLTGSLAAGHTGSISDVKTLLGQCPGQVPCSGASAGDPGWFTSATLATPISVVEGQIIQVTVVIGFS